MSRSNSVLRTVEKYDPSRDQWNTVAALNTPRSGACAVAFAGKIYAMGGASHKGLALDTCEVYHASQDKWFFFKGRNKAISILMTGNIHLFQLNLKTWKWFI